MNRRKDRTLRALRGELSKHESINSAEIKAEPNLLHTAERSSREKK